MRIALFVSLLWLSATLSPGHAQAFSPVSLVGKWTASEKMSNGTTMTTQLTLTQSMKFTGVATLDGREYWTFAGTWEVDGSKLVLHYETSSRPLPESAKADVDDIVSIGAEKLVVVSRLGGKQHEFTRLR